MGPKPQKSETPFVSNLEGNVGQNGFQWTRLAELVCMPRVSARDLDSEIKFFKHISKTLVARPILAGMEEFLLQQQIMYFLGISETKNLNT